MHIIYEYLFRNSSQTWIGLHAPSDSNCNTPASCRHLFSWVDGTPVNDTFSLWFDTEPTTDEKCARIARDGTWRGSICEAQHNYICSRGKCMFLLLVLLSIIHDVGSQLLCTENSCSSIFTQISMNVTEI